MKEELDILNNTIINCRKCDRIMNWIKVISQTKTKRFSKETYWGKPVPSFGDPNAELLVVGLAPAAHGANRTGRMFTGDRSGEWLYKALYDFGFSNKPESLNREDELILNNCWITAALHCVPPSNKPNIEEILNCNTYLLTELKLLTNVKVILTLGSIAFDSVIIASQQMEWIKDKKSYKFSHGALYNIENGIHIIASYHPSQQNTFTKKLTHKMFDEIFRDIVKLLNKDNKK